MKIYHNHRCTKSRQCLTLIGSEKVEIVEYMKNPLSKTKLFALLKKLQMKPSELLRKKEKIWINEYRHKNLSEDQIVDLMIEFPNLIERPIVELADKAQVCRPPELVFDLIK